MPVHKLEMEYDEIPQNIRAHISRALYDRSLPATREALIENANELYSINIKFYAVGMRYYGDHVFTMDDDIRLEKEDDNPHDSNAIKVMVDGVHKAYVSKLENKGIRYVEDFEHKKVKLIANHAACSSMNLMVS
jgi:hypothetical protein